MTSKFRSSSSSRLLPCLALSFIACGADTQPLPQEGLPQIQIAPDSIYFDRIEVGQPATRTLSVTNAGSSPLTVEGLDLQPLSGASFQLSGLGEGQALAPNETVVATISVTPDTLGLSRATLTVASNDPLQPELEVSLEADVVETVPLVPDALALDFGIEGFGCWSARRTVTIQNPNSDVVLIQNISIQGPDAPAFRLIDASAVQSILPGGDVAFEVQYQPRDSMVQNAKILVQANLRGQPIMTEIDLTGAAGRGPAAEERLQQLGSPKIDLLIVIDDGPSMADEQDNIRSNAAEFIQKLVGFDYQVGVTTTQVGTGAPSGRLLPLGSASNIVRSSDVDPAQQLVTNVSVGLRKQAGVNRGLEAVSRALGSSGGVALNPGFVRSDAALRVIIISDNDDASARSVAEFRDEFSQLKPNSDDGSRPFELMAVGGQAPAGCNSTFGSAQFTPRYFELTQELNGAFLNVCDDTWNHPDIFPITPSFRRRFFLNGSPKPETLSVRVNQVDVPQTGPSGDNWSYVSMANAIDFANQAVPPRGAEVLVGYDVECSE